MLSDTPGFIDPAEDCPLLSPREILALTPGYNDMDLTRLPWRYETRPIFPLDRDMAWRPLISNVAGYAD